MKKRIYNHPNVEVSRMISNTQLLAGSTTPDLNLGGGGNPGGAGAPRRGDIIP